VSEAGLRTEVDGDVLVCTIDRPDRGNALRHEEMVALADAVEEVSAEGGPRAVLLRSEGRHFCTGADIGGPGGDEGKPATGHLRRRLAAGAHRMVLAVWECRVPVVAAVHGRADGLGCNLAAAADIAIAGRSATFSEPFVRRGFSVDSGGSWLLTRRVGLTRATAMLLHGESVGTELAQQWGLAAEVVDDDDLDAVARTQAAELASGATLALSLTKGLLKRHAGAGVGLWEAMEEEAMAVELSIRSDDFKEGMRAFLQKRPPEFKGR
jgi:2-(1,2-epoxy-1,2-dihydrophenyl)acetyl-CoA isomerase